MEFLNQVWQTNILLVVLCGIQVLILLEMYARAKRGKCTRDLHGSGECTRDRHGSEGERL